LGNRGKGTLFKLFSLLILLFMINYLHAKENKTGYPWDPPPCDDQGNPIVAISAGFSTVFFAGERLKIPGPRK
jgi:asparagine N-glycosylation enzyme membrane subunit Stt3